MALAVFLVAFGSSKAGFLKGSDSVIGVLFWIAFYLMYLQVEDLMELESSLFHQVATEVDTEVAAVDMAAEATAVEDSAEDTAAVD